MTNTDHFERPVVILTGLGHPTAISSAMEAYVFLADWPPARRDAAHDFAMKACLAAVSGEIEAETAKGMFVTLAEKYDILAPEIGAFATSRSEGPQDTA